MSEPVLVSDIIASLRALSAEELCRVLREVHPPALAWQRSSLMGKPVPDAEADEWSTWTRSALGSDWFYAAVEHWHVLEDDEGNGGWVALTEIGSDPPVETRHSSVAEAKGACEARLRAAGVPVCEPVESEL